MSIGNYLNTTKHVKYTISTQYSVSKKCGSIFVLADSHPVGTRRGEGKKETEQQKTYHRVCFHDIRILNTVWFYTLRSA